MRTASRNRSEKVPACVSKYDRIGKFVTYPESNNKKKNT